MLVETPGGGVSIDGGDAKTAPTPSGPSQTLAARADAGAEVTEADVRAAIGQAAQRRGKRRGGASALPVGRARRRSRRRPPPRPAISTMLAAASWSSASARPAPARPSWPSPTARPCCCAAQVDRLVVTRPAVEAGERLGFLPGDLNEKVDPYMAPIWEALNDILGAEQLRRRRDKGEIEVAPIAFMRGRTLSHAFVIVDEAQNASRLQMKMVLTRLGEGARMVVTGDPSQVDLLNPRDSGLAHAVRPPGGREGRRRRRASRPQDVVRHPWSSASCAPTTPTRPRPPSRATPRSDDRGRGRGRGLDAALARRARRS